MLQFITILTISTALSVAAYKIQNNEMQNSKKPLLIPSAGMTQASILPID
ncbi:MAG: hypothetical protein LW696_01860 [Alphaproteobacteria bacterium]|jgi:hypothetical protein|nr:hypothetical protein [Alphaproteobacteria bacterium]